MAGFSAAQNTPKPNVLFIAVDDLRPELGCYGHSQIHSPNIDKLAETGLMFTRSYCNIPVCGASRASILSGIRPNRHRFLNYDTWLDKEVPGTVSLPMHFKNNGYTTVSLGNRGFPKATGRVGRPMFYRSRTRKLSRAPMETESMALRLKAPMRLTIFIPME